MAKIKVISCVHEKIDIACWEREIVIQHENKKYDVNLGYNKMFGYSTTPTGLSLWKFSDGSDRSPIAMGTRFGKIIDNELVKYNFGTIEEYFVMITNEFLKKKASKK